MKADKTFQVKEVCSICNVTRKALLIYEEKGLLKPYYVNKDSGYRYYNAENISKILHIRRFQSFGFSLDEIYEYLSDTKKLSDVFARLNKLKADLEESIEQLRLRMMNEDYNSQEIIRITLPDSNCYARRTVSHSYKEALEFLRDTHLEAIKTGLVEKAPKMHTTILSFDGDYPDIYGVCDMLYCIPMTNGYDGENALMERETPALSLFHRGPYTTLIHSIKTIMDYCHANGIKQTGPMRLVWLEGPPVHGAVEEKYLTQIVIPIENQ